MSSGDDAVDAKRITSGISAPLMLLSRKSSRHSAPRPGTEHSRQPNVSGRAQPASAPNSAFTTRCAETGEPPTKPMRGGRWLRKIDRIGLISVRIGF